MREMEVKARLHNRDSLIDRLISLGCSFSQPTVQHDRIFLPIGSEIPVDPGVNVLRIREQDGRCIFTLKQPMKNQLDCIERELEIDSSCEMIEICKLLGFYESSQVKKQRQKIKYNDLQICLDNVEGLGDFIEVEKITSDDEDSDIIQNELFNFLESLGVGKRDRVFDGYDVLLAKLTSVK